MMRYNNYITTVPACVQIRKNIPIKFIGFLPNYFVVYTICISVLKSMQLHENPQNQP